MQLPLNALMPVMPVIIDIALIIILTPLAILLAGHLAGVEKATALRSIVIAIFGLLTLGVLVLDIVLQFAGQNAPVELGLSIPQRLAVYFIVWIVLIKLGFESSFLDAFTVGVSAAVMLIILTWLVIVITTPIWTGLFSR